MEKTKTYRTNRFLGFVITLMGLAIIFSVEVERLVLFYKDPIGIVVVGFFAVINPLFWLFGFSFRILPDQVVERSYFVFGKRFKINDLSHVLYQPTWRGITPMTSSTNMRSLHIVRHFGGWRDTISLANGAFREEDLADIAKRLRQMNPRIETDEYAEALIKKYSQHL